MNPDFIGAIGTLAAAAEGLDLLIGVGAARLLLVGPQRRHEALHRRLLLVLGRVKQCFLKCSQRFTLVTRLFLELALFFFQAFGADNVLEVVGSAAARGMRI